VNTVCLIDQNINDELNVKKIGKKGVIVVPVFNFEYTKIGFFYRIY